MFWIFTAIAGLLFAAVTLGKYAVWFALLRVVLIAAVLIIVVLVIALSYRRFK